MNDEHLIALGKKITKLTDIYIQKKPDLIELCKSKQLKSVGTVDNLRARLSRYYKGIVELGDIEETLSDLQKIKVQKDSIEDRIDITELLTQSNLSDSSPETSNSAINRPKTINNDLLNNLSKDLEENANKLIIQAEKIENLTSNLYQNDSVQAPNNSYNNLINLDPNESTKVEHIYEDIISPIKTDSDLNTTFFSNSKFVIDNTPEKLNILENKNPKHKMEKMIVKPDSFSGQGDIKTFIRQYEKAAQINNWNDDEKIKFLSIFLKETANKFLQNLENKRENWSWENLKSEFINEFQPIGYSIILKNKLENRKQNDLESISSFVTEIEYLCSQVQKDMKEEDICVYILKGIREPILHAISLHDNSTLKKLKENLKKYELMQFRINSRSSGLSEYTEILNKQVMQLNNETKDSNQEIKRLNTKLEGIDSYHKNKIDHLCTKIDQLCTEMHNIKKYDKTVNFENRSRNRDKSPYPGRTDHEGRNNYREKSPYPDRYDNYKLRDSSRDRYNNNKYRNNSREMSNNRDRSDSRNRENSYDRSRNRDSYKFRNRENDISRKQHSRENMQEKVIQDPRRRKDLMEEEK
ncbi:unnamed protein product [Macrosiphum euphorbiae]|uniref:Retrotransposon gag domain-containing protein n=1 Tax=Macrosiphum euphorbiae TaxID=13131 RepID=A0AAV0X5G1_9HEMI|nr:unnamed protein product [Macrosiphum euphorbiae]